MTTGPTVPAGIYPGTGITVASNGQVRFNGSAGVYLGAGPITTQNSTLDEGSGDLQTGGSVQAGGLGVRLTNSGFVTFLTGGGSLTGGVGAPGNGLGNVGDFYFRSDTPTVANQRIYVKTGAAAWTGIL